MMDKEEARRWLPLLNAISMGIPVFHRVNGIDTKVNEIDITGRIDDYHIGTIVDMPNKADGWKTPEEDVAGGGGLKVQMVGWWFPVWLSPRIRISNITEAETLESFLKSINHDEMAHLVRRHIQAQTDGKYLNMKAYETTIEEITRQ
jgi:hypothetical protein